MMETIKINVLNVKCGGCTSNIEKGLMTVEGVESVKAVVDGGEVTITGNNLDRNAINEKLASLGYPENSN